MISGERVGIRAYTVIFAVFRTGAKLVREYLLQWIRIFRVNDWSIIGYHLAQMLQGEKEYWIQQIIRLKDTLKETMINLYLVLR